MYTFQKLSIIWTEGSVLTVTRWMEVSCTWIELYFKSRHHLGINAVCTDFLFWGFFFCLNKCYRLKKDKIAELYGMVRLCLALEEIAKSFAKEPVPFAPPASTSDGACCVACSPAFGVPVFWILAILRDVCGISLLCHELPYDKWRWASLQMLICHLPWWGICSDLLPFFFFLFSGGLSVFLLLSFQCSLYF